MSDREEATKGELPDLEPMFLEYSVEDAGGVDTESLTITERIEVVRDIPRTWGDRDINIFVIVPVVNPVGPTPPGPTSEPMELRLQKGVTDRIVGLGLILLMGLGMVITGILLALGTIPLAGAGPLMAAFGLGGIVTALRTHFLH